METIYRRHRAMSPQERRLMGLISAAHQHHEIKFPVDLGWRSDLNVAGANE